MHIKPLFQQGPSIAARFLLVCILLFTLFFLDYKFQLFTPVKSAFLSFSTPLYEMSGIPSVVAEWTGSRLRSRESLQEENARLQLENTVLQAKVQKMVALTVENVRLRELLNSAALRQENVDIAEIIGISPDPLMHYVLLNKGADDGVFVGQAVIDANGVFGQVIEVSARSSRVLLISDTRHAVPVQVNRNGARIIVEGTGSFTEMNLPYVAVTTDIVVGDVLSTSGLGSIFPQGYPVARVTEVFHDPGQAFAVVKARPFAALDRTRYVLLLFHGKGDNEG